MTGCDEAVAPRASALMASADSSALAAASTRPAPTEPRTCRLGIVIPVLNEARTIADAVAAARAQSDTCIVVDGGSTDDTVSQAQRAGAQVVRAKRGRALQMNAGAQVADCDVLLFLHADCRLPIEAGELIRTHTARGAIWGRFDVRLDSPRLALAIIAWMMNLRSRLTGIATGDQGIFVARQAFEAQGGFPAIALMEDIAFSRSMRRIAPPVCLRTTMLVSARRWEHRGVVRTVVQMWGLRAAYFFGASPDWLHRQYYGRRPHGDIDD